MTTKNDNTSHRSLLSSISPVISELVALKLGKNKDITCEAFRSEIISCFDSYERDCYENQITTSYMQEAKFALAALVDEMVMSSGHAIRMQWMSRPLQLEFFGNNRAGEEFFERLDNLQKAGESKASVLEVYYLCLQLGFEGAYKVKGLEQLKALIIDIRSQLEDANGAPDIRLSSNGIPTEDFVMKVGRNIPYWVIFSVILSMIVMQFVGFHFLISDQANSSKQHIDKQIEVVSQLDKANL
ncbi:type IVB secretion system protein IcmH/DotU [Pseudoalteromonas denitrificans]|uniref:Type VI secretion system protein ImpK n=1 Tax=Pseudoalteromonas denitrificans DSM 6059 TaxID=1123010 RepID=A0A1I1NE07_9GAMM|nr:type IVB secretion system protein IcmH/DotU [Pseudoalteromonas denitrificans]SFC95616.1 type VI secretion system protein ImpK [Pseudoalteromonas denitrificans DSM 6059]